MKRLRLWLRELTLTQQLTTIVFLVIAAFAVFIFAFLSPQINSFTTNEMYRVLHNAEETGIYLIEKTGELPGKDFTSGSGIVQAVYDPASDSFSVLQVPEIPAELEEDIISHCDNKEERHEYSVQVDMNGAQETVFYTLEKMEDGRWLVSMLPGSYESDFRGLLVNRIINSNMLVAIVLFVFLTAWIASLIYPLNQIKTYINKIKNDEDAELTVDRRDEIGEVADALRDMKADLDKQNREKQEMIQNISHDLKTPIAIIRSYSESIKDGIYPYGTLEKSIDVIIEHTDRLDKKVRSLIALNKMDYLLDETPPGDNLKMSDVIDKVLLSLKVVRPEITFERDVDESVMFHGEEDPWRVVIENLVDNALRYARSRIVIRLRPGELSVSNDGSHIAEDQLDKLFNAYEKGSDGQFGLGLSIVARVASTYGYHVDAENLEDGVMFRIWKELDKKERKAIQKKEKKEEADRKKEEQRLKKERKADAKKKDRAADE